MVKMFMGPDTKAYQDALRASFNIVKSFKPQSSRSESKEIFYVGLDFKQPSSAIEQSDISEE